MKRADPTDTILCECEMVARSTVDEIVAEAPGHEAHMGLDAIARRSRICKGACQGAVCAMRVTSHLCDSGLCDSHAGLDEMRRFIAERFKGSGPCSGAGRCRRRSWPRSCMSGSPGWIRWATTSWRTRIEKDAPPH